MQDEHEAILSNYIWLTFEKTEVSPSSYIPYNCQFLIFDDSKENDEVQIMELYNPRRGSPVKLKSFFGTWIINNGLTVSNNDFYKRRFDMNRTYLSVKSFCEV